MLRELEAGRATIATLQARDAKFLAAFQGACVEMALRDGRSCDEAWEWGMRDAAGEFSAVARVSERTTHRQLGEAVELTSRFPATLAAFEAGSIHQGHVRVILDHGARLEDEGVRRSFEERVVERAQHSVRIRDLDDGLSELVTTVPTVFAHAVHDRLTQMATTLAGTDEARSFDELRTDLLLDLLLTADPADGSPHGAVAGVRAQVSITVPALALLGADPVDTAALDGRGPVPLEQAMLLARGDAAMLRVITDPVDGRVLATDKRVPHDTLARHVRARDQHCRFAGCRRAPRRCDLDHAVAWAEGGEASADNLACLCARHHALKHSPGWSLAWDDSGNGRQAGDPADGLVVGRCGVGSERCTPWRPVAQWAPSACARTAFGLSPYAALKTRLKCAASRNPHRSPICAIGTSAWRGFVIER